MQHLLGCFCYNNRHQCIASVIVFNIGVVVGCTLSMSLMYSCVGGLVPILVVLGLVESLRNGAQWEMLGILRTIK